MFRDFEVKYRAFSSGKLVASGGGIIKRCLSKDGAKSKLKRVLGEKHGVDITTIICESLEEKTYTEEFKNFFDNNK